MNRQLFLLLASIVLSLPLKSQTEMTEVFLDDDLSQWVVPEQNVWWSIEHGILNVKNDATKEGSILWTKKNFQNFTFKAEFLMGDGTVDSGVFLRSESQQIQIGESGSLKRDMTGSIYIPGKGYPGRAEGVDKILKPKEWNALKIKAIGNIYTVWLNDKKVLKYESSESIKEGQIGLQLHPNREMEISFRNIEIGELPPSNVEQKKMENRIQLLPNNDQQKVDVFVEGSLFTSYIYPKSIKKPVLYPIITPMGTKITRKFPLEKSVGERVDHPHHVGLWFNYGDVNGLDFWNNSDAIAEEKRSGYGTIVHKSVRSIHSGDEEAVLEVSMEWKSPEGQVLLIEDTRFVFRGKGSEYSIDRITKLTAKEDIDFKDNKEGVLGIRVVRALEHPSDKAEIFTDASGKPTKVAVLDNNGVNGNYINAEGIEGVDVWAKRSNWVNLRSVIGDEKVSLVILDHKNNVGHPTYWHARGYGLFAANPLGQKVFSKGENVLNFSLDTGDSTTFRHQIIVASKELSPEDIDSRFNRFSVSEK